MKHQTDSADKLDDIDRIEQNEMAQNIRVDAPSGEMCLAEIQLDVAQGHREIEQYKDAALCLYEALNNRLAEEKKRNPNSPEVKMIEETKETVSGMYNHASRTNQNLLNDD